MGLEQQHMCLIAIRTWIAMCQWRTTTGRSGSSPSTTLTTVAKLQKRCVFDEVHFHWQLSSIESLVVLSRTLPVTAGHVQPDAQHLRRGGRLRQPLQPQQEQDAPREADRHSRTQESPEGHGDR